jgi:hypothetical protein
VSILHQYHSFDYPNKHKSCSHKGLIAKATEDFAFSGGSCMLKSGATNHMNRSKEMIEEFVQELSNNYFVSFGDSRSKVLGYIRW